MNTALPKILIECAGWTLLHFLWQGAALAALLGATQYVFRFRSPAIRYWLSCATLLLMALAPIITFNHLAPPPAEAAANITASWRVGSGLETAAVSAPAALPTPVAVPTPALIAPSRSAFLERLEKCLPYLVAVWAAGVLAFSARLGLGWLHVRRLARQDVRPIGEPWESRLARLAARLRIRRPLLLLESGLVQVPTVIGWLRPVILLPAGCMAGLSPGQLESILAHELAHISRHDCFVNVLQTVVETLLFYHPAVWWVSRRIREERELCCDDQAVQICGNPLEYARALAMLAEAGLAPVDLAVAASGPPLLRRIQRLAGQPQPDAGRTGMVMAGVVTIVIAVALVIGLRGNRALAAGKNEPSFAGFITPSPVQSSSISTAAGNNLPGPLEADSVEPRADGARETNTIDLLSQVPSTANEQVTNAASASGVESPEEQKVKALEEQIKKLEDARIHDAVDRAFRNLFSSVTKESLNVEQDKDTVPQPAQSDLTVELISPEGKRVLLKHDGATGNLTETPDVSVGSATTPTNRAIINLRVKFAEIDEDKSAPNGLDSFLKTFDITLATNAEIRTPRLPGMDFAQLAHGTNTGLFHDPDRPFTNAIVTQFSGILTQARFRDAIQWLEQHDGTDILSAPDVTTESGREASVQVTDVQSIVSSVATNSGPGDKYTFQTTPVSLGPALDAVARLSADGKSIELSATADLTEFLGYDKPDDGKNSPVTTPLPRFLIRELSAESTLERGQTLILCSDPVEKTVAITNSPHGLGTLPLIGRLFRSKALLSTRKMRTSLLIFITPTVLDSAGRLVEGNPAHASASQPAGPAPIATAIDEAVRRQAETIELRQKIQQAAADYGKKDLAVSVMEYDECLKLALKIGSSVDGERKKVEVALSDISLTLAKQAQTRGDFASAGAMAYRALNFNPQNQDAVEFKQYNDKLIGAQAPANTPVDQTTYVSGSPFNLAQTPTKTPADQTNRTDIVASAHDAHVSPERAAIYRKMREIKLDSVRYDNAPLSEVIDKLSEAVRAREPEHLGVNFMVDNVAPQKTTSITNIPASPSEPVDWKKVTVNISPALESITLEQALDAIVHSASKPIKYEVQDYAIVFSMKGDEPPRMIMKMFHIDPNAFPQAINASLGTSGNAIAAGSVPGDDFIGTVRQFFNNVGINLGTNQTGKVVVWNNKNNELLIRATPADFDVIERVMPMMNASPPLVNIRVRYYIQTPPTRAVGFHWFLGQTLGSTPDGDAASNSPATFLGILTRPQFQIAIQALQQRDDGASITTNTFDVTTGSGRQVHFDLPSLLGTNVVVITSSLGTNNVSFKPGLDLTPLVSADGFSINLTAALSGSARDPWGNPYIITMNNTNSAPDSHFRMESWDGHAVVWDGQTLVLSCAGSLSPFQEHTARTLIFITSTLLNPDGSRLHSESEIPSGTPPQTPPGDADKKPK